MWAETLVGAFTRVRYVIDSAHIQGSKSDGVLAALKRELESLGYVVETGKRKVDKIHRPVLFGDQGEARVRYEVDAWLEREGVIIEIEAGRGIMGNALYRDIIRGSLIVGAKYLVIGLMNDYQYQSGGKTMHSADYEIARDQLDAIYASGRLGLPFKGILLVGY